MSDSWRTRRHVLLVVSALIAALLVAALADRVTFGDAQASAQPVPGVDPTGPVLTSGRFRYAWTRDDGSKRTTGTVETDVLDVGGAVAIRDVFPDGTARITSLVPARRGGWSVVREDVFGATAAYAPHLPVFIPSRPLHVSDKGFTVVWGSAFTRQGGRSRTCVCDTRTVTYRGRKVRVVTIERTGTFRVNELDGSLTVTDEWAPSIGVLVTRSSTFTGMQDGKPVSVTDRLALDSA